MKTAAVLAAAAALAAAAQAEWATLQPNLLTIAFGVSATSKDHVVLTGSADGSGGALLVSHDGFQTWEDAPHDLQMMYMSVDMYSDTKGIAGSLGFWGATADGSFTTDGQVWSATGSNILFSAAQSAHAFDNSTFLIFGIFQHDIRSYTSGVKVTHDAGATFSFVDWQLDQSPRYGYAVTKDQWIITGGSWSDSAKNNLGFGQISAHLSLRTRANGKSYVEVHQAAAKRADGYIGVIGLTTDGGKTWTEVFHDEGNFYFNGVSCVGRKCWAVAEGPSDAWIFHSPDGGFTWTQQHSHAGLSLIHVDFSDELTGWAAGGVFLSNTFEAVFLFTNDGGATWTASAPIKNAYANWVSTVSAEYAYSTAFLRNGLSGLLAHTP